MASDGRRCDRTFILGGVRNLGVERIPGDRTEITLVAVRISGD